MTTQEGQNLVLVSGITTVAVEALKIAFTDQTYNARLFIGGGIAFTTMAGVAEFAPGPAALLAVTVMLTVLLVDGAPVITKALSVGGSPSKGRKR